jgi:CBS domain-containing protein
MLVKEIMTGQVITVDADASVLDVCNIYKQKKVGCLVVTKNGLCVGIVTERDIIERTLCQLKDPQKTKVDQIMSQHIKVVNALDTVEKSLQMMKDYKIKKLPVISSEKVVGIITITDIAKARPDLSERFMESWMKAQWRD